ncbi:MAG: hypothetical protein ACPKQO_04170 [Nitrososphaeraceae archaeon]
MNEISINHTIVYRKIKWLVDDLLLIENIIITLWKEGSMFRNFCRSFNDTYNLGKIDINVIPNRNKQE